MNWRKPALFLLLILLLATLGCAAGNTRYDTQPAGFLAGLWHGFILVITFIISLFTDKVQIYEINNIGGWYDFGFVLGAAICLGGSHQTRHWKKRHVKKDWEEIGKKVEEKVKKGIQSWVEDSEGKKSSKDWDEIGRRIEEKIKSELKNWLDRE